MNPIMSRIHSGDRVSIMVAWSPNIMIMYFISSLPPSGAPVGRSHDWVGAGAPFSTSRVERVTVRGLARLDAEREGNLPRGFGVLAPERR